MTILLQITIERQHEGSSGTVYADQNNSIYGALVIMQKKRYVEIWYNTDDIQILCVTNVSYSTVT